MDDGSARFRFSPRPNRADEIAWHEWDREAFARARSEGKLVLLSISAVWCHWCHVMDETTYSDPRIIEAINRDFVPVRVDSDMRPDLNSRYNRGGWPTTAFLLPSGRAVAGLTYTPPDQLLALLQRLSTVYRHRRREIEVEAASRGAGERMASRRKRLEKDVDGSAAEFVAGRIVEDWDREYGGFGPDMKFPPFGALEFAIQRFVETGDPGMEAFAVSTLDGMSLGGLEDRVEGGFFRYSTTRDWSVPHYEKMLEDNARMVHLYLGASIVFGRQGYAETARRVIDYLIAGLLDGERRGFFGSQDADESYYLLDGERRAKLRAPAVDRTIYVDSTSVTISALAYASAVLEDLDLARIARAAADHAWHRGFRHPLGVCHYFDARDGSANLWGQAKDQAALLRALVDLYQATGDPVLLDRALELAGVVKATYVREPGWLAEAESSPDAPGRILDDVPADVPDISVNAEAARALLLLDALEPGAGFGEVADGILRAMASDYRVYGHFASGYALAVGMQRDGLIEVRLDPGASGEPVNGFRRAAMASFDARRLLRVETVDDYVPSSEAGPGPPAVVCTPGTCVPVYTIEEVERALDGGRASVRGTVR